MHFKKWLWRIGASQDEFELYCGSLIIIVFAIALISLQ
jgi:hypothetical protein